MIQEAKHLYSNSNEGQINYVMRYMDDLFMGVAWYDISDVLRFPAEHNMNWLVPYLKLNKDARKQLEEFIKNQPENDALYELNVLFNDFISRQKRNANRELVGLITCFQIYGMARCDLLLKAMETYGKFNSQLYDDPIVVGLFLWICLFLSGIRPDIALNGKSRLNHADLRL